jgi:glutathione peroxidase
MTSIFFWLITSLYSIQYKDVNNITQSMSQFQNKKILIVNIATGSSKVNQLAGLQQLQQLYGDSVVIIVFPSNSFGYETRSDTEIKQFCTSKYGATFKIAAKNNVTGNNAIPVFNWLAHVDQNGIMDAPAQANFQKFLIGKDGNLIGVFAPSVDPMDNLIRDAITGK